MIISYTIDGINVSADESISKQEVLSVLSDELTLWRQQDKVLDSVEICIEDNDLVIYSYEKSPINRVRRITGYLAPLVNFNTSKKAELNDRYQHTLNTI